MGVDPLDSEDITATYNQNVCLNQEVRATSTSRSAHRCVGKGPHAKRGMSFTLQEQSKLTVIDKVRGFGWCQVRSCRNS